MKQFFVRFNAICRSVLIVAALLCGTAAIAQNVTVKGKILDNDGLPLPGAAAQQITVGGGKIWILPLLSSPTPSCSMR